MKENYEKPIVVVEEFKTIDVISTSTSDDSDNPVWPWD